MVLVLAEKLFSLLLMMLMGFVLVRAHITKAEESKMLSRLSMYLLSPCTIFTSFQMTLSSQILHGLLLCLFLAISIHILFAVAGELFRYFFHLSAVEESSIIYTNCGNIIIPIVATLLGPEYVIYTSAYISVYNILVWTHGLALFRREQRLLGLSGSAEIRGSFLRVVLLNPNILAILFGLRTLLCHISLPSPVLHAISDTGSMVGPVGMIIIGMVLGGMPFSRMFENRRVLPVSLLRLFGMPMLALLLIKLPGLEALIPDGHCILMVTFLSSLAPVGATANMFAILFDQDAEYASTINVLTTVICIASMPFYEFLYELF